MGITSTLTNMAESLIANAPQKAEIVVQGDKKEHIPVQFNPSEYSITTRSEYSQKTRRKEDEPVVNYNGSPLSQLRVKLIFNSDEFFSAASVASAAVSLLTGGGDDMAATISKIADLTKISGEKHQPPMCVFSWGSLQFSGFVENVGVTYTMFKSNGQPLRATVDLTMQGINLPVASRKSPFMSPDRTKARTMTEDNNIWLIAEKEYGDVREWRRIADANDIMDPLDIPVGSVLKVPSIND